VPELAFAVLGAEAVAHAAVPTLGFRVRLACAEPARRIESVLLQCQLQLEPPRRGHSPDEQARLLELFGTPERWGRTLRPLLWAYAGVVVPRFEGETTVLLPVACSYDFEVLATKYLGALDGGDVPLAMLFNGSVFYRDDAGALQVMPIPWAAEARAALPVAVWREVIERYFPGSTWLRLRRDAYERLVAFRQAQGLPTFEHALERLLPEPAAEPSANGGSR